MRDLKSLDLWIVWVRIPLLVLFFTFNSKNMDNLQIILTIDHEENWRYSAARLTQINKEFEKKIFEVDMIVGGSASTVDYLSNPITPLEALEVVVYVCTFFNENECWISRQEIRSLFKVNFPILHSVNQSILDKVLSHFELNPHVFYIYRVFKEKEGFIHTIALLLFKKDHITTPSELRDLMDISQPEFEELTQKPLNDQVEFLAEKGIFDLFELI